ncbi:hypothetical protein BU17DRAFT_93562 [Hysterangium stoloniferum]|nr:hypothetical protein BU17DRAFT_93562 [Hysterangium stoloniferum]
MSVETPSRHHSHYFSDLVIFLVENQLVRVPRHMFISSSPVFEGMFSLPAGPGNEVEGQTDATPIQLDEVSVQDFECLLELLYPTVIFPEFTLRQWSSILHLAKKWDMADIRRCAIKTLDKSDLSSHPLIQIDYGKKYDNPSWIREGFITLISREESLTASEMEQLGWTDAAKCAHAREVVVEQKAGSIRGFSNQRGSISEAQLQRIVGETFGHELLGMELGIHGR